MDISTSLIFSVVIALVGLASSLPVEPHFDLQMDILSKLGVTNPSSFPSVHLDKLVVPEYLRRQYESLQRRHRVRRAFITKGIHKNPDITGEVSFTDPTRQLFTFDISHIPEGSEVIMAELKVFKERPNHSIFKPGQDGVNSDGPAPNIFIHDHPHTAVVSIKQITGDDVDMDADPADLAANLANQHEGMSAVAVDQREMTLNSSGWKVFDVTNTIQSWVADPQSNLGIALHIDPVEGDHHAQRVADEIVFATEFHPDSPDSSPVLVIYTTKFAPSEEPNECSYEGEEEHRCCRRRRYIDFHELSWTNRWIIEPAGFDAFECYGPCHNPRSRHIRDLFALPFFGSASSSGSTLGSGVGRNHRTCGISKSSALPMMYLSASESGIVELKVEEIPNMIVDDCHCTL